MRKPLVALSLALSTSLGAIPVAGVLAAPTASSPPGTTTPVYSPRSSTSSGQPTASRSTSNAVSGAAIVQTALKYIGYPYTATGNSPATGFSCIGFASFVYRSNGIALPGDLQDALAFAPRVPFSNLLPGDLLYFQNTVWNGLSHVAIYIGGGRFVHAEWYNRGVRISSFNNDPVDGNYWIGKYLGANRPWSGAAVSPVLGTPAPPATPSTPNPGVSAVTNTVTGGKPAVVKVSSLNVRAAPGKTSAVQTIIPQGTSVTIVGQAPGWYKVQLPNGSIGWVIRAGVSKGNTVSPSTTVTTNPNIGTPKAPTRVGQPSTAARPVAVTRHVTAAIHVNGLRVHSSPSMTSSVLTSVSTGQKVTVLSRVNGWMKVRTSTGVVGWVVSSYTSRPARASTPTYNAASSQKSTRVAATRTVKKATSYASGPMLTAGVRVHARSSLGSRVIGMGAAGTHVRVLGRRGAWTLVRLANGLTGYVYGAYVR